MSTAVSHAGLRLYTLSTLTLLLAAFLPASSAACPTGLVVIPTADTLGAGAYSFEAQIDHTASDEESNVYLLNTEIGLGSRFEAGIDFDLSSGVEHREILNAKYKLAEPGPARTSLALGVQDVAKGQSSSRYLALTRAGDRVCSHAGLMRAEGRNRWFAGIDAQVHDKWTLMADYTHGKENVWSVGAVYLLHDEMELLIGAVFPNDGGSADLTLHFVFNGSYKKGVPGDRHAHS